jgi:hypothetical protein
MGCSQLEAMQQRREEARVVVICGQRRLEAARCTGLVASDGCKGCNREFGIPGFRNAAACCCLLLLLAAAACRCCFLLLLRALLEVAAASDRGAMFENGGHQDSFKTGLRFKSSKGLGGGCCGDPS